MSTFGQKLPFVIYFYLVSVLRCVYLGSWSVDLQVCLQACVHVATL